MRMLGAIIMPLLFLVVFGAGLTRWMDLGDEISFSSFLFPGIVGMTVIMAAFMSGVSIVWDREFGFLKEVLIAPISRTAVAIGKTLGGATIATIQGTLMLLLSPIIGIDLSLELILKIIPLIFMIACAIAAMGIVLAARIKSMEAFQALMNMLMMPMIFLSGVFFPLSNLPGWMNVIVKINPVTYGVDSIRKVFIESIPDIETSQLNLTIFNHTMSIIDNVLVVAVFGFVMIMLSMWFLRSQN